MSASTSKATYWITGGVGVFAFADSYSHIYALARDNHADILSAALVPFTIDGLVMAASHHLYRGEKVALARTILWIAITATLTANIMFGLRYGVVSAVINAWPAGAFLACAELIMHPSGKRKREAAREAAGKRLSAPRPKPATAPREAATASPSAVAVEFAEEIRKGELPAMKEVQRRMGGKWPTVQGRHAELAALIAAA